MLKEFRCSKCNKLLGKIEGRAEIVCTRCKVMNEFNVPTEITNMLDTDEVDEQLYTFYRSNGLEVIKKNVGDASTCWECNQLHNDSGRQRCSMYDNAIIEDTSDKHCLDSVR
ncbi:phage FluMu protein Com [Paenibacillus turicensis]|uniref:Phage FluMu protein Com n=1 Tax=Paenibacillus turicensis TaxID=160487 RepID=A0ABS4FWY6_9BACL|nr:phage FluMu protein Com [Paenibacillus turicensis]